uniref:Uncharacterized protein n=1 Tax=Salix viminalis TaxID=40686 RepID=A0A6N2MMQ7_SALVM
MITAAKEFDEKKRNEKKRNGMHRAQRGYHQLLPEDYLHLPNCLQQIMHFHHQDNYLVPHFANILH